MKWLSALGFMLLALGAYAAQDMAIHGISIGDDAAKLSHMPLKVSESGKSDTGPYVIYLLPDGNQLWVSADSGKVSTIEESYQNGASSQSFVPGVKFGKGDYAQIKQTLTQAGFKYVYRAYFPIMDEGDLYDCYADAGNPDRFLLLKGLTAKFDYHPGMSLDQLPYELNEISISTRKGVLVPNPGANACEPDKVLTPALPLTLSSATTDTPQFSLRLPQGFPRVDLAARTGGAIQNSGPGFADYIYSPDPAPKGWLPFIQVSFVWPTTPGTNITAQSLALPAMMYGSSKATEQDQAKMHRTISGMDFQCTGWIDENGGDPMGGYICFNMQKDMKRMIVIFVQDADERYQQRKAIYMQVIDSIKLKPGAPSV